MDYSRLAYTHHKAKAQAYGAAGLGTKARAHAERARYHRAAFGSWYDSSKGLSHWDGIREKDHHRWRVHERTTGQDPARNNIKPYTDQDHNEIYASVLASGAGIGFHPKRGTGPTSYDRPY